MTAQNSSQTVIKAVIPAAGLGTRFLPATKSCPKEMLPVVDRPAIQYVVQEAVSAGAQDILMITGRSKRALEDHFDRVPDLEASLEESGKDALLASVQESTALGAELHYLRQGDPQGLGHAVLRAKTHVGNAPFAVLLGDDLIDEKEDLLAEMMRVQVRTGGSVIALMEVPEEQVSSYGCAAVEAIDGEQHVRVTDLVEKPSREEAPSNLAVIGRYVVHPRIFEVLEETPPGRGGEIQLTDALMTLAQAEGEGAGVYGVVFRGRRFDTGDKLSYLKANVILASEREDLGPGLRGWLKEFVQDLPTD